MGQNLFERIQILSVQASQEENDRVQIVSAQAKPRRKYRRSNCKGPHKAKNNLNTFKLSESRQFEKKLHAVVSAQAKARIAQEKPWRSVGRAQENPGDPRSPGKAPRWAKKMSAFTL